MFWDGCQAVELLDRRVSVMCSFFKKLPNCFPEWLHQLPFLSAMGDRCRVAASYPAIGSVKEGLFI